MNQNADSVPDATPKLRQRWAFWQRQIERELAKPAFAQDDIRVDPYKLRQTIAMAEAYDNLMGRAMRSLAQAREQNDGSIPVERL